MSIIPGSPPVHAFVNRNGSLPISARRSFKRVLSAIKTITLLYQKQRSREELGRFIADISDYAIVYQLMEESFAESLGDVKRYTDDRIRMIEIAGMMTPRDLAEKVGVTTAAISPWSKGMIEKGVLSWCDADGARFSDDLSLEKAKRSGKAYLKVVGGNRLPSPFQLTGDPRWDRGGDLWDAHDLQLGDGGDDSIPDMGVTENIISEAVVGGEMDNDGADTGVKVLSGKTDAEIKKMMKTFREREFKQDAGGPFDMELLNDFSEVLSTERLESVN